MHPIIESIEDLKPHLEGRKEFVVSQRDGLTNINYLIQSGDTFDNRYLRECRGITFDDTGKIISRPLHKFFNLYENEDTQMHQLPWCEQTTEMPKIDGSMGASFVLNGKAGLKTRGGHHSRRSIEMTRFVHDNQSYLKFLNHIVKTNRTACFEFVAPHERIVVNHGEEISLTLLHIRDNVTGEYVDPSEYSEHYGIPMVSRQIILPGQIEEYVSNLANKTETEGVVFQFPSGEMVKCKTLWYLQLHKVLSYRRERDFARLVISGKLDDVKSMLSAEGFDVSGIEMVEAKVNTRLANLRSQVEIAAEDIVSQSLDGRASYEKYGHLPYFKLIRSVLSGKVPPYLDYFERNILKQEFSLDTVD